MDPYTVIVTTYLDELETRAAHYMKIGWIPTGGITLVDTGGGFRFYQAMFNPASVSPAA